MIKRFTLFSILCLTNLIAFAQDDVKYRVILFGDAGEMNPAQMQDLKKALPPLKKLSPGSSS